MKARSRFAAHLTVVVLGAMWVAAACNSDAPGRPSTEHDGGTGGHDGGTGGHGATSAAGGSPNASGGSPGGVAGVGAAGGSVGAGGPSMGGAMNAGAAGVAAGAGGTPGNGGAAPNAGGADGGELDGSSARPDAATLGAPCVHAADCGGGQVCVLPSGNQFEGGGVANGICTLDCSQDLIAVTPGESACAVLGPSAVCLQVASFKGYCVETCTLGPVPSNVHKCHDRQDMACTDSQTGDVGYCKPTCRGDFDCVGRVCDLGSGVCKDSISSTRNLPAGAKCDPNAQLDICRGACVGILDADASTPSVGFCSGYCRLGQVGCGVDPASSAPAASSCLFGTETTSDLGDLGFCAPLCDCNDDCLDPDLVCAPVAGLEAITGRTGACSVPSTAAPRGVSCGAVRDSGTD